MDTTQVANELASRTPRYELFAVGLLFILLVVPFTLTVIMAINQQLLALGR